MTPSLVYGIILVVCVCMFVYGMLLRPPQLSPGKLMPLPLLRRYLAAQSVVYPQTYAAVGATALAPALNWLLVFRLGFGLDGAAATTVLIAALQAALLLAMVVARERRLSGSDLQTWHGW